MVPGARLVIDIGGQDSKAITVDADGLVEDFAMNDRCASGTGRFYEVLPARSSATSASSARWRSAVLCHGAAAPTWR